MLKGGVIMDVTSPREAEIAEKAGAVAVMALQKVPADLRKEGKVARMADPKIILEIKVLFQFQLWQRCELVILLRHRF